MEIPEKFPKIVIDEMPEYFQYRMIETKKALEQNLSKFSSLSVSAYFFVKSRPIEASSRAIDNTQQQLFESTVQGSKNLTGKRRKFTDSERTWIPTIFALEATNTEMHWSINIYVSKARK